MDDSQKMSLQRYRTEELCSSHKTGKSNLVITELKSNQLSICVLENELKSNQQMDQSNLKYLLSDL